MNQSELTTLLSSLTVREKVGQLVQWTMKQLAATDGAVTGPDLGKVHGDGAKYFSSVLNFASPEEANELQKNYLANQEHKIPLIFMMDVVHGCRTIFPEPLAMAGSFDTELMEECSAMAAKEASAYGVHLTFAPMVDHCRDARWGRVMESGGEDPYLSGAMGAATVRGFQGTDLHNPDSLATCVKHYAAYGAAESGRDYNQVELSERVLREWYLPAYRDCIEAGARMVMPSFNSLNGMPSVANRWLILDVLRREWGFDGAVISDYNALNELIHHGVAEDRRTATKMCADCECDIDMVSGGYAEYLADLVESGAFPMEKLDRAVMRVLKIKNELGLFEDPYRGASKEKIEKVCFTAEHRALAKKAALESAVLLKNEGVLPFDRGVKTVALIGPFADCDDILGAWFCYGKREEAVTVRQGIETLLPDARVTLVRGCSPAIGSTDESGIEAAVQAAKNADVVILCVGEERDCSGEGRSRATLTLPGVQEKLIHAVSKANPNTALLLFNGRPLELTNVVDDVPAILEMWMPGTEGGSAAAELLFGVQNPCGKLAMSFPKSVGQMPLFYAYSHTGRAKKKPEGVFEPFRSDYMDCGNLPLFPFGFGMSYTTFRYDSLTLNTTELQAGEPLTAEVTLTNTGSREGCEVVELYLNDQFSSLVTPVQKLAAFAPVTLAPGETKTVSLTIAPERMALWTPDAHFTIEPGTFTLFAGYADHPLLTTEFRVY